MNFFNIVGYEAIKKLANLIRPDIGKPLGMGLPSKLKILGGEVLYGEHKSNHPLLRIDALNGLKGPVNGVAVSRTEEGQISAIVSMVGPYQQLNELNKLVGIENFEFLSSDEYVSVDQNKPTIFQNLIKGRLEPGAKYRPIPGLAEIALPFGFDFFVETVATGFVEGSHFIGVIAFAYDYKFIKGNPIGIPHFDNLIQNSPSYGRSEGEGQFKIIIG